MTAGAEAAPLERRNVTYRTRIPGAAGTEIDFESRETGKATLEAVTTSLPFAGAGAPIVVGSRRQTNVVGAVLAPPRGADDGDAKEADSQQAAPD